MADDPPSEYQLQQNLTNSNTVPTTQQQQPTTINDVEVNIINNSSSDNPSGSGLLGDYKARSLALSGAILIYVIFAFAFPAWWIDETEIYRDACEGSSSSYCDDLNTETAGWALIMLGIQFTYKP